mmetsp:Transcript_31889/g.73403  ORF Transcript_31889/g.73403 Transcript_31889/m.73403 type:complete len:90 (+) Transcript_31889:1525-1794(+)
MQDKKIVCPCQQKKDIQENAKKNYEQFLCFHKALNNQNRKRDLSKVAITEILDKKKNQAHIMELLGDSTPAKKDKKRQILIITPSLLST